MDDVAIAGAGPAGALAAAILARAGLRVRVFDRARFPRHKLCGDTLNPGALDVLGRHLDVAPLVERSGAIHGMLLTGPGGVRITGEYGGGRAGRSITRAVLDQWLIERAMEAGAEFEENAAVRDVSMADGRVGGVVVGAGRREPGAGNPSTALRASSHVHRARMVIAADGRRSAIAIGLGLSRQPRRPRRWAIGNYFSGVTGMTTLGEMHVRRGHYIGVAPVPGGLANACLVVSRDGPYQGHDIPLSRPQEVLEAHLRMDPELSARFSDARPVEQPVMLGPMAVDAVAAGEPGLLLAGDAAGFIDPMTGDGLRFALMGAELAAALVLETLAGTMPIDRAHIELAARRRKAFRNKWRFNRTMRSLVSSPASVTAAALTARVWPSAFAKMIQYAGDCEPPPGQSG